MQTSDTRVSTNYKERVLQWLNDLSHEHRTAPREARKLEPNHLLALALRVFKVFDFQAFY
jgi:hypothetical protein